MKDYYQILGVSEEAGREEIRSAFRKLAFAHHPDTASGDKKQAEGKFKEINEAYGVLGDEARRREYDFVRRGQFVGYGAKYQGFAYSQQDIFRDIFTNQAMFSELSRMFQQAGLRFDQDFLNQVFFRGGGIVFQFSFGPGGLSRRVSRFGDEATNQPPSSAQVATYQPGWIEKLLAKVTMKLWQRLFGFQAKPLSELNLDQHLELEISPQEAASDNERDIVYQQGRKTQKLRVKIPAGIKPGTKIKLSGMGKVADKKRGDLYLHVKIGVGFD